MSGGLWDGPGMGMTDQNERTFRELTRELRSANRSERTISAYHQACLSLERWLSARREDTDLLAVTREQVQGWLIGLKNTHSADSIASYFRSLRAVYNWMERQEDLLDGSNPVARMTAPAGSGKPIPMPKTDAIKKVLAACAADKSWMGKRDEAIIRLFCQAGAPRVGELCALLTENVNLDADMVTVNGKTGWRMLPLEPKTAKAFARWQRARNKIGEAEQTPQFFVSRRGWGGLQVQGIYLLVRRRCEQAGVGRIHPHQFRHWATREMKRAKMNEGHIMVLNGWKTRTMLDRYGAALEAEDAAGEARFHVIGGDL